MSPETSSDSPAGLRVGYILTHYPRLAQTFIAGEIDAVERAGVHVVPFAMNMPTPSEQAAPGQPNELPERPISSRNLLTRWSRWPGSCCAAPLA
jgi:hypothetical protein